MLPTYRCENGETASDVIWDDESLVSLLGCERAERTFRTVGNGYDTMFRFLFAHLLLQHGLEQTEGECGLGSRTRFRDIDDTELLVRQELHQLCQIVLADVVAGIDYVRVLAVFGYEGVEGRSESLIHSTCTEIRTADTGYDNHLATLA